MEPQTAPVSAPASPATAGKRLVGSFSFDQLAFFIIAALVFLLPLIFLPSINTPFQMTKTALALIATFGAFICFAIARLKEGALTVPYNLIFGALSLIPLSYLLSALFSSPSPSFSLAGGRLEIDTAFFMALMVLLTVLTSLIVRKERILTVYTVVLASLSILALFQALRLIFGTDFLSFGIFTDATSNLIGKWNDIAIFFGFTAILSLVTLEGLRLTRASSIILYVTLIASLFFVALINFLPVWIVLGLFALGLFVYGFFRSRLQPSAEGESALKRVRISLLAIAILVISMVFVIFSDSVGNWLASAAGVSHVEARPSWQSTLSVLQASYRESPVFGVGPSMFEEQWAKHKPDAVNQTIFWNTDFSFGIGLIPTSFITTGLVGALSWLFFLAALLWIGIRALLSRPAGEGFSYYLTFSSFIATVYLWIFMVSYVPSVVLVVLTFISTGLFLASLRPLGLLKEKRLVFAENPKLGFATVLLLTVLLVLSVAGLYLIGVRYGAAYNFQKSVVALNVDGDVTAAKRSIDRAIGLHDLSLYRQLASQIQLVRLNEVVNGTEGTLEERRTRFQNELAEGILHAQRATELQPSGYQNWITLGQIYASVVPLQIQGSYESSKQAYEKALALAPQQPQIYQALAELETLNQDLPAAKEHLSQALSKKSNYTAAVYLLAQIQMSEGDLQNALSSVEAATLLAPQNPVLFFQLGLLRYNARNYEGATTALEQAIALNEAYANARYFLGLSYAKRGRADEAIAQFERVSALNPENTEVRTIIENLRAGKDPLTGLASPTDELPIEGE